MPRKSLHSSINNLSYKSLLIIFFFLLISIVILWKFVLPNHKVSAAWWNDGWNYRKAINISNTGTAQTNTQIKILDNYNLSALVTAGKLQADLDDLRFTDSNGNLLKFWIEDSTNNSVDVWAFLPSIPTSGATVYMYYGNPSITNGETIVGTNDNPGLSCKAVKLSGGTLDNIYYIDPTGGNVADAIQIYCDLNTDSGGWMLIGKSDNTAYTHAPGFFSDGNIPTKTNRGSINVFNLSLVDNSAEWMWQDTVNSQYVKFSLTKYSTIKINPDNYTNISDDTGQRFISSTITSASSLYQFTAIGNSQVPANAGNFSYATSSHTQYGNWGYAYYAGGAQTSARVFLITNSGGHEGSYGLYGLQRYAPSPYIATNSVMMVRESAFSVDSNFSSTFAAEEAGGGPIAYWKFNEGTGTSAYDSTTNQNNGIFGTGNSAPTWADESQCVSGKCLKFDGTNQYTYTSQNSKINLTNNAPYTINYWLKLPALPTGFFAPIMKGAFSLGYGHLITNSGNLAVYTDNDSDPEYQASNFIQSNDLNKWVQITQTYNGSSISVYKNGKIFGSSGVGISMISNTQNLYFGTNNINTYFLKGLLDDIKIYPYARTADQIKKDYNSRGSSKGTSANLGGAASDSNLSDGLVGYWKMDEGTGTSILDSSGTGNTGTFTSASWSSGKFGVGGSFPGSVYVNLGTNIINQTTYTKSLWIKINGNGSSENIFSGNGSGHVLLLSSGLIYMSNNWNTDTLTVSANYGDNNWHLITTTYDGTKGTIYMDGIRLAEKNMSNIPSGQPAYIGSYGGGSNFNGLIDEVRLYNRALSPSEVTQLYEYAPGPVGYWDFEENTGTVAKDKSGNNYNGTLATGNSSPSWSSGKRGSALNFGGNDYVDLGDTSSGNKLSNLYSATYSFWIYPQALLSPSSADQRLIEKRDSSISSSIATDGTISTVFWYYTDPTYTTDSWTSTKKLGFYDSGVNEWTTSNLNKWYYITIIFDSPNNIGKTYINGILDKTYSLVNNSGRVTGANSTTSTQLGRYRWNTNYFYQGKIDDVKIYNYARSAKQIVEDMNGNHSAVSSKSILAYYKFDEGSGTTTNNSGNGGSALNGTLGTGNSTPTWQTEDQCVHGKCLNILNGATYSSRVLINNSVPISNVFTISHWLKTNSSGYTVWNAGSGNGYRLGTFSGKVRFLIGNSDSNYTEISCSGARTINNNKWHLITGIYDNINHKFTCYIDGTYEATVNIVDFTGFQTTAPQIGGYSFYGLIDEVKIYNYALTDDEIKQDYNQGSALQMGQTSQTISGTTTSLEYCIPGDTSPCASPVAEWNFEENTGTTAKDSSGNNNNGTFGTGSSAPTWTVGKKNTGAGVKFDGVNDYVNLGTPTSLNSITYPLTISLWAKPTTLTQNGVILSLDVTDSNSDIAIGIYNTENKILIGRQTYQYGLTGISSYLTAGKWQHWEIVFTDTTHINFYLDGIQQTLSSVSNYWTPSQNNIGAKSNGSLYSFNGSIDGVKIYNYARTPAQVAYDYNKGGPIGWWKFDECQGSTANDSSGIGNTGSINISASGTQTSVGTCTTSGTAWGNGASGKINASLNFDGTDDYVQIPNIISGDDTHTISFWVKPKDFNKVWLDMSGDSGYSFIEPDSSHLYVGYSPTTSLYRTYNYTFTLGNWYYITIVKTGAGDNVNVYINGILQTSYTGTVGNMNSGSIMYLGKFHTGSYNTNGQIDDVRIYNYALTPEQVKTLYNGGAVSFN